MPAKVPDVTEECADSIKEFIRESFASTGASKAVIGLSGGIDSAVVSKLCADALGPDRVLCVFMPSSGTPAVDFESTRALADSWGVGYRSVDIAPIVAEMEKALGGGLSVLDRGNLSARCRMAILFSIARQEGGIVMGTSNRSEYMMGYFTKFGDGACDIAPLVRLYKTQVRQLAKIVGIPGEIIAKPPSADLWEGQTDESDMGIAYEELDPVLLLLERGVGVAEISGKTGLSPDSVSELMIRVESMAHKRVPPLRMD